jgi:hypothetical protein
LSRCANRWGEAHKETGAFAILHRPGPEGATKEVKLRSVAENPAFLPVDFQLEGTPRQERGGVGSDANE